MANVDKNLYNAPATDGTVTDKAPDGPKRGLKGAASGIYVGPVLSKAAIEGPSSPTHPALPYQGGGVEDTSGYRTSDTYNPDALNGVGSASSLARPTRTTWAAGAQATPSFITYTGNPGAGWVQVVTLTGTIDSGDEFKLSHPRYPGTYSTTFTAGTDMTAAAIQSSLRTLFEDPLLTVTGTTDVGPFRIVASKPLGGGFAVTEVTDTGSDLAITISRPHGDRKARQTGDAGIALGAAFRGSNVDGSTVTYVYAVNTAGTSFVGPTVGGSANPSAGTVGVITGSNKFTMDEHATDVTNYGGAEVLVFAQDPADTVQDGAFIGAYTLDSATEADALTVANVAGLVDGTYNVYVRYIGTDGNVGPLSALGTVAVS